MISTLVTILIFLVIFYVVKIVIGEFGLPPTILRIVYIVMGLIALLWLLSILGVYTFPLR